MESRPIATSRPVSMCRQTTPIRIRDHQHTVEKPVPPCLEKEGHGNIGKLLGVKTDSLQDTITRRSSPRRHIGFRLEIESDCEQIIWGGSWLLQAAPGSWASDDGGTYHASAGGRWLVAAAKRKR